MYVIKLILILFFIINSLYKSSIKFTVLDNNILDNYEEKINHENVLFITKDYEWSLSIPKINLNDIPIEEGIENDILENYIGHFPITSCFTGNVCLAAHNNGFRNNYFNEINLLEIGDDIYYNYSNQEKVYTVKKISIIEDDDFSILEDNNEDKLTLITCITNSPHKRLCIQAICKE